MFEIPSQNVKILPKFTQWFFSLKSYFFFFVTRSKSMNYPLCLKTPNFTFCG